MIKRINNACDEVRNALYLFVVERIVDQQWFFKT